MEEQSLGGAPVQHLGQRPKAEAAEAAMEANYDAELTEEHLQELWRADTAARDREIGGTMGNYVTDGLNREYEEPGEEPGGAIFSQARGQEPRAEEAVSHGSGPRTQAVTHSQTPGHLCSMPQSGLKNPHASAGRAAEQPASGGGVSDTLDQDLAHYRQLAETLRRERDQERLSAERRAKQDELAALRRECEQLQTAASQATPRAPPGIVPSISPDLSRSCGWGNAATGTGSAGTVLGACGHQGGFDSRGAAAAGPALPPPGDAMRPTATPPGLEFLGREPPSGALARPPPPSTEELRRSLRPDAGGLPSNERSHHFAEYGNGRVPGSPGGDELRANAEMANAPSRTAVGETRRKLFGSDATSSDQSDS